MNGRNDRVIDKKKLGVGFNVPLFLLLYNCQTMKQYRNSIFAILLFSFMLSVFHDYAFFNTYATLSEESHSACMTQPVLTVQDTGSHEALKLQVHHGFHVLLETPFKLIHSSIVVKQHELPFYYQKPLFSRAHPVPLRPPVA